MTLPLPILVIGDCSAPEFRPAAQWLGERGAVFTASLNDALAEIENGFAPAIVLIAAQWPGQIAAQQIEHIRRAAPLAQDFGTSWPLARRRNTRRQAMADSCTNLLAPLADTNGAAVG